MTLLVAIFVGVIVVFSVLLLTFYKKVTAGFSWHIWLIMTRAKPKIKSLANRRGVKIRVVWFGAVAVDPRNLSVWIKTEKDSERDALIKDPKFFDEIRDTLKETGYLRTAINEVGIEVQSQQTVDRDSGGRWYWAMK